MAGLPQFPISTQTDPYWEIPMYDAAGNPLSIEGRVFEAWIAPAQTKQGVAEPVAAIKVLTFQDGLTLVPPTDGSGDQTIKNTLVHQVSKDFAQKNFPRGELTADLLEVVGNTRRLFSPVRLFYLDPAQIREFVADRAGITFGPGRQPIVTPVAIAGQAGRRGSGLLTGTLPPQPSDGEDGDYWVVERTGQANVIYGPKEAGEWPAQPSSTFGVGGVADVPGLPAAIETKVDKIGGDASALKVLPTAEEVGRFLAEVLADRLSAYNVLNDIPKQYHASILNYSINNSVDLWQYMQKWLDRGGVLSCPDGKFPYSKPLLRRTGSVIIGNRPLAPIYSVSGPGYIPVAGQFKKYVGACWVKTGSAGLAGLQSYPNGATQPTDLSGINACLISAAQEAPWIVQNGAVRNIGFFGLASAPEASRPIGHYQFVSAWTAHEGCAAVFCRKGFSSFDAFLQRWIDCTTDHCSDIGFDITATSNTMARCYAMGGRVGYRLSGQYHSLVGAAADGQSDIAYWGKDIRQIRLDGGTEQCRGNKLRLDNVATAQVVLHVSGVIEAGTSFTDAYTGGSTAALTASDAKQSFVFGANTSADIWVYNRAGDGFRLDVPVDKVHPASSVVYKRGYPGLPGDRQDMAVDLPRGTARGGISTVAYCASYADNDPTNVQVLDIDARLLLVGPMMHVRARLNLSALDDGVKFALTFRNPLGGWVDGVPGFFEKGEYLPSGGLNPFGVVGSSIWASTRPGEYTGTIKLSWAGSSWATGKALQPPIFGGMDHRTGNVYFYKADGTPYTINEIKALGNFVIVEGYYLLEY